MDMNIVIILSLVGVIIVQAWHTHCLINKLMSRNFQDYAYQKKELKKEKVKLVEMPSTDQEDLGLLNSMLR